MEGFWGEQGRFPKMGKTDLREQRRETYLREQGRETDLEL